LTALSWAINALFFSGDLALARALLTAAILAFKALDLLPPTAFEIL
jgi:hypothetical protein